MVTPLAKPQVQAEPILEKNSKIGNQTIQPVPIPTLPTVTDTGSQQPPTQQPLAQPDLSRTLLPADTTPVGSIPASNQPALTRTLQPQDAQSTALATPTAQTVNNSDLVSNNLNDLISENSKYLQLARTGAKQTAASRGLLNSSIAAGAGEDAAIRNALPIAQQDASTNFAANTNTVNSTNRFAENQQQQNFALNRDYQNAGYSQDNNILQANINEQAQLRDQNNALARNEQQQGFNLQRDSLNAGYTQDNMLLQADISRQSQERDQANQLAQMDRQSFITTQRDNLLQGFQTLNIDQQQANNLETIAAQFANTQEQARFQVGAQFQSQFLSASSNLQNSWSAEIQSIYQNPNMTPEQQSAAVREATSRYQNQASVLATMYGEMGAWNVVTEQFPPSPNQQQQPPTAPTNPAPVPTAPPTIPVGAPTIGIAQPIAPSNLNPQIAEPVIKQPSQTIQPVRTGTILR